MIIWPARLAERYITPNERKDILNRVNDLIQTDRWPEALTQVVGMGTEVTTICTTGMENGTGQGHGSFENGTDLKACSTSSEKPL